MQQTVAVIITLVGDGSSTVFTVALSKLFELSTYNGAILNPNTLPTNAQITNNPQLPYPGVASVDAYGNLVLIFNSPWPSQTSADVEINLLFSSGDTVGGSNASPNTLVFSGNAAPAVASQYTPVAQYTVPSGRLLTPVSFRSLSATAGYYSSLVSLINFGQFVMNTNTWTAGNAVIQPRFMFSMFLQVTTQTATNTTVTVTYTNDQGVTGRTATASLPNATKVGARIQFTPMAGDNGVLAVTNVTQSPNATGAFIMYGANTITYHRNQTANTLYETQFAIEQVYVPGDIISLEIYATSTTAVYREIEATFLIQ